MGKAKAERIAFRLLVRGLLYRLYRITGWPLLPAALSLEITTRCIARCVMCNIWKKRAQDLPLERWLDLLRSPVLKDLKELDLTGGEPFLRQDLEHMLEAILAEKGTSLGGLRSIAVTTNGFLPERVVSVTSRLIGKMKEKHVELVMVFSLDGIGETHDRIRGFRNGWERLKESIEGVMGIRQEYENLILGVKTTILPMNVGELEAIWSFAEQNRLFTIISPFIRTENRYENADLPLRFSQEDLVCMRRFFEEKEVRWDFHRMMILDLIRRGRVKKPCSAGFNYYFIRSTGEIYPCPLVKESVGNFLEKPLDAVLASKEVKRFRLMVGRFVQCQICTEPGLERYALPFEGFQYLRFLLRHGRRRFLELHNHMGLGKYL